MSPETKCLRKQNVAASGVAQHTNAWSFGLRGCEFNSLTGYGFYLCAC